MYTHMGLGKGVTVRIDPDVQLQKPSGLGQRPVITHPARLADSLI
jgi:hypothetical protein